VFTLQDYICTRFRLPSASGSYVSSSNLHPKSFFPNRHFAISSSTNL